MCWVIFKEGSPVTNKMDLVSKLDRQTVPISDPQVGRTRWSRRFETGDPITLGQLMGRCPRLVPLTHHALLNASVNKLSGPAAGVGEVGHVVPGKVHTLGAGVHLQVRNAGQVRIGETVDKNCPIIGWQSVFLMCWHLGWGVQALNV